MKLFKKSFILRVAFVPLVPLMYVHFSFLNVVVNIR